jgi:nucleotide-binding universal stress UspA family protein
MLVAAPRYHLTASDVERLEGLDIEAPQPPERVTAPPARGPHTRSLNIPTEGEPMVRILVPSDGSPQSLAAVRYAARFAKERPGTELVLLNVQAPVSGTAATFVGSDAVRGYHKEQGTEALREASKILDGAGVVYDSHIAAGPLGGTINAYAEQRQCDHIIMGTSGVGGWKKLLGSTAISVLEITQLPVTFVK